MRRAATGRQARSAFTIVEILVVVALVLVLLSIVVVAVGSATRTAQRTNTAALMSSIKQSLVHFREDVGYLPPVLDRERNLRFEIDGTEYLHGPDPSSGQFRNEIQEWYSVTSLAEYLIGYGSEQEDGHDGPGIRNPGPDGYWGATVDRGVQGTPGTFDYRVEFLDDEASRSYREGRVYGPYLQLSDDRLLGVIDPDSDAGQYDVFFPGEAGYDASWPRVIVDYWGEPIRYYRKPYPSGGLARGYRQIRGQEFVVPTLADVFVLRPWTVRGSEVNTRFEDDTSLPPGGNGDTTASYELQRADFALLSSGPDRRLNQRHRIDRADLGATTDGLNEDNIVELGP